MAALRQWIRRWGEVKGCEQLVTWVEENIEETFSVGRLLVNHRRSMTSNDMLEGLNQDIKRRMRFVRVLPSEESYLSLIRSLAVDTHEHGVTGSLYLTDELSLQQVLEETLSALQEAA